MKEVLPGKLAGASFYAYYSSRLHISQSVRTTPFPRSETPPSHPTFHPRHFEGINGSCSDSALVQRIVRSLAAIEPLPLPRSQDPASSTDPMSPPRHSAGHDCRSRLPCRAPLIYFYDSAFCEFGAFVEMAGPHNHMAKRERMRSHQAQNPPYWESRADLVAPGCRIGPAT